MGELVRILLRWAQNVPNVCRSENDYKKGLQGTYAGIGSIIHYSFTKKTVVIDEPFEGSPAAKAGLKKGDEVVSIDNKFKYDRVSSEMLKRLTEAAKAEGYYDDAKEEFTALENKLNHNTEKDLDKNRQEIKQLLATDILSYYYFRRGAIEYTLKHDPVFNKEVELLNDQEAYNKILHVSCK